MNYPTMIRHISLIGALAVPALQAISAGLPSQKDDAGEALIRQAQRIIQVGQAAEQRRTAGRSEDRLSYQAIIDTIRDDMADEGRRCLAAARTHDQILSQCEVLMAMWRASERLK